MKRVLPQILVLLVMVFSFTVVFPQTRKPLSIEEVGDLLRSNVSKKRVLMTLEENGVRFPKTKAHLEALRKMGVDETLLATIEKEWNKEGRVLIVETVPAGATIHLDGEKMGETPLEVEGLRAKKYSVRIELGGYEPVDHEISLMEGIGRKLTVSLVKSTSERPSPSPVPTPTPALPPSQETTQQFSSVFINTQPGGAKIFIDGKHYGTTPKHIELLPGEYTIVLIKEFYKPAEKKIVVREGETVLPPIDQRLVPTR